MNHRTASKTPSMSRSSRYRRAVRVLAGAVTGATILALTPLSASAGRPQERPGCPLRFDQETTGLPRTCLFVGRFNTEGSGQVMAAFAGDGSTFVVALARSDATPLLYLPGAAVSPVAGDLLLWQEGVQPAAAAGGDAMGDAVVGSITLEDSGRRLRVRAAAQPGSTGPPAEFVGQFATMVEAEGGAVMSQR
jgi:hypothetical protein